MINYSPKISIIICTYYQPLLIKEAIESVLKQSFKDFEIIVINDNPHNCFLEDVILSYNDSRIIYIQNKKNLKNAKSLNIGLNIAKGKYIAILDDDDIWISKDKLEKQLKFLEKNSKHVIVGTSSIEIDKDTDKEISRKIIKTNLSLLTTPFAHSSILCRKKVMLAVQGYSEDLPRAKDIDLFLKIAKFGKFGFLPECFIKHREIFLKETNTKKFFKKKYQDLFFHSKVIFRHRKEFPNFWKSYLEVILRYILFKISKVFPLFYKIIYSYKRMDSVSRMSLDVELKKQFKKLKPGSVLEIGSGYSSYKKLIPHKEYMTLDSNENSNPDIYADLHNTLILGNSFDTIIAIEVLEHVQNPQKAITEMLRILKPRGTCIISTRFIHAYHPGPKDYYRFTWDSLYDLFKEFNQIEVYHHGNMLQSIWHLFNDGTNKKSILLNIFNPIIAKINSKKTKCPCGFIVSAQK